VGNRSLSHCRRVMINRGIYVVVGARTLRRLLKAPLLSPFVSQNLVACMSRLSKEDLVVLKELIEARKVTPVIYRSYTLSEVPEAIRYLEEGHARGKVVINFGT
jgi:D-arabinose 1-dehydrogenase-like Zn-dependent alcohol dehydrogenase